MTGPDGPPTDGLSLAVDLGTSHTVAMLRWPDGRSRPLLFDGQPLLPSAVFRAADGRLHVGQDALRLGHAEPARLEPNPKRRIDDESVLLGDASVPVPALFAALLGAVAREAVATAGSLPPAVLTYPAAWGARRREVLTAAVAQAGWPAETSLLPEPVAAARYFAEVLRRPVPVGSALAVFDFGGGTLDVAVVRHEGHAAGFTVAASGGLDDLGGLDLDAAVVEHLGKSLAGAEPAAWTALTEPVTLAQWRARQQFWADVRGAKEMLSRAVFAPVPVLGVEHAVPLTRDEFEAVAGPLVRRGVAETGEVIAAAGLAPGELAGLFLVGGSSRVPLVARLLHSELGIAPTVLEQPELPVAEGALAAARSGGAALAANAGPTNSATPPNDPPRYQQDANTPTPSTRPNNRPPTAAPTSPAPRYAEPVDPWATAEAAAIAAAGGKHPDSVTPRDPEPWLASADLGPGGPSGHGLFRRAYKSKVFLAASLVVVLGLAATLVLIFWPRNRALDFAPLADAKRFAPAVAMTSKFADAEIAGDRAYFASVDDAGTLGVVAVNAKTDKQVWSSTKAGTAAQWDHIVALPGALAAFTDTDSGTRTRRMVILAGAHGEALWERTIGDDDAVYFVADVAVLADRTGHRLLGLEINGGGKVRWEIPDVKADSGTATRIVPATTEDDLAGPATVQGTSLSPDAGNDSRIVQISADRSARVIDGKDGRVLVAPRQSVADTDDEAIAHNGRLIVRESENAHRIMSYDLGKLGEPKVLYTAPDTNHRLTHLTSCGPARVCFVESTGYDDKTAQVISVDADKGGRWTRGVPMTDNLVPVGGALLAAQDTTPHKVSLIDADGKLVWTREGEAARLNSGNALLFLKELSDYPDDSFVWGDHVGDAVVPLGALGSVRSSTCSWNTAVLACVTDKDFVLQRFAK